MKTIKYILSIVILTVLFVKCGAEKINENNTTNEEHNHSDEEETQDEITVTSKQFINANMELGVAKEYPFSEGIKTTGTIDVPPQSKAVISSFVGGKVKNAMLLIGDKVKKGQALVTVENISFIELQQDYLEVAEQINYLKAEFERQKDLFKDKIVSQKIYLKAESDYKITNSKYLGMKKKLELLNINITDVEQGKLTSTIVIYSPINGSISKLNVSSGSYVNPTDEIMEIINTNHIHVELSVFEKDALRVKKGQKILFKVSESSSKYYEAEVHLVGTAINPETRAVTVHGHLNEKEQHNFLAGMFVDAEILTNQQNNIGLPASAILENNGKNVVLVLKSNASNKYTFQEKEITTGQTLNGFVEIKSLLNIKDTLLIKGGYSLVGVESGGHSH